MPIPRPWRRQFPWWRQLPWRRAWLALPLALLLGGCDGAGPLARLRRDVLHVVIVPTPGLEWLEPPGSLPQSWWRLQRAFRELHPDVRLRVSVVPEAGLAQELAQRQRRGLGPDLLLLRTPVAISLLERSLIDPLPASGPLRASLETVQPESLVRVNRGGRYAGLPLYTDATLACYDRRRLERAPADIGELLAVAASGSPVGLAVDPTSLWWTAGALGADDALAPILLATAAQPPAGNGAGPGRNRLAIEGWLQWLRQVALQNRVDIASGPQELVQGLEAGRLTWIPCFSPLLARLNRTLGPHLGVAPLPNGPGGKASPFTSLRVWSFGRDSSPHQRRLAEDLAVLSLNPVLQRSITLATRSVLPANRYVPLPVASSGQLAALAEAQQQFLSGSRLITSSFSSDRVNRLLPPFEEIVGQVMVGAITPAEGAEALIRLKEAR